MINNPLPLPIGLHNFSVAQHQNPGNQKIKFVNPNTDNFERNIRNAAKLVKALGLHMPQQGEQMGRGAVVCGSGPSLNDPRVVDVIRQRVNQGYLLFATKAAINWLAERGLVPDYGVSMDPGAHIASPRKIKKVPGVKHIIASSSDPSLFDYLLNENEHGPASEVMVFHSACGLINEVELYKELFPESTPIGGGYNVINRAIGIALHMGCLPITLAGNDSGWRAGQAFYCDGNRNRPGVDMNDGGQVELTDANGNPTEEGLARNALVKKLEGLSPSHYTKEQREALEKYEQKVWHTRPDMLASAVAMVRLFRKLSPNMEFLGDTLPFRLQGKSDAFLKKCADFSSG